MQPVTVGPVQLLAFGFDSSGPLPSEVGEQLRMLLTHGVITVLDVLAVSKNELGVLRCESATAVLAGSPVSSGSILRQIFDDSGDEALSTTPFAIRSSGEVGLDLDAIENLADRLQPGTTSLLILVESTWAVALREAALSAGGFPIVFGILEPETMLLVGPSLACATEARTKIEIVEDDPQLRSQC